MPSRWRLRVEASVVDHDAVVRVSACDRLEFVEQRTLILLGDIPAAPMAVEEVERRRARRSENFPRVGVDDLNRRLTTKDLGGISRVRLGQLDRRHARKHIGEQERTVPHPRTRFDGLLQAKPSPERARERNRNRPHRAGV
jgi:hypothetical protein